MTYFKEALSAPALHFKRLRLAEPMLCNGSTIARRTHSAIETEIWWEGRYFLLYLPFHAESIRHIEEVEAIARERSRGPLLENRILYDEFTMVNSLGQRHKFDIILQELPSGLTLKEVTNRYRADDLRVAIHKMKSRLDAIGFLHNNLTPANVIICDSGVARPLRYWYAEWEIFSDNDISQLLDHIDRHGNNEHSKISPSMLANDCEADYCATPAKPDGIRRLCKGHRYGFVDCDGVPITRFEYSWASDFCEGRAIVAKSGKMGVIDSNGKKVIPVNYDNIEFDIETGFFTATKDGYCYLKNYEGETIRRTKTEESANSEVATKHF